MNESYRGRGLLSLALAVVALWFVVPPWLLQPLQPLTTFLHEAGHALGCLLTGGSVSSVVLAPGGGGWASTAGGWRIVVLCGGYVGTALFGALFLHLNAVPEARRRILGVLALFVLAVTVWYGSGWYTWAYGLATAAVLGLVALYLPVEAQYHLVTFLGLYVGLSAVESVKFLVAVEFGWAQQRMPEGLGHNLNDAQLLAQATWVPAVVWASGFVLLAVVLLGGAVLRTAESE